MLTTCKSPSKVAVGVERQHQVLVVEKWRKVVAVVFALSVV